MLCQAIKITAALCSIKRVCSEHAMQLMLQAVAAAPLWCNKKGGSES